MPRTPSTRKPARRSGRRRRRQASTRSPRSIATRCSLAPARLGLSRSRSSSSLPTRCNSRPGCGHGDRPGCGRGTGTVSAATVSWKVPPPISCGSPTEQGATHLRDGVAAGSVAALVSGAPSTLYAVLTRGRLLEPTLAAGTLLLPRERRVGAPAARRRAGPPRPVTRLGVCTRSRVPRERTMAPGALAGLGIAALDLGVTGRHYPRIRELPKLPQVADHVAYGNLEPEGRPLTPEVGAAPAAPGRVGKGVIRWPTTTPRAQPRIWASGPLRPRRGAALMTIACSCGHVFQTTRSTACPECGASIFTRERYETPAELEARMASHLRTEAERRTSAPGPGPRRSPGPASRDVRPGPPPGSPVLRVSG
jgi:hypothetical protein